LARPGPTLSLANPNDLELRRSHKAHQDAMRLGLGLVSLDDFSEFAQLARQSAPRCRDPVETDNLRHDRSFTGLQLVAEHAPADAIV
jgi:hypothetical protein